MGLRLSMDEKGTMTRVARLLFRAQRGACGRRLISFPSSIFYLLFSAFLPAASAQDAAAIARKALQVSPAGEWDLTAVLSTRVSPSKFVQPDSREFPKPAVAPQQRNLTIQLRRAPDGSRQIIYRSANGQKKEEGLRVHVFQDSRVKLFDLITEKPVLGADTELLGSAFSCADVSLHFLSWKTQKLLGEETVRDRPCWRIGSHPPVDDNGSYQRVESWIDREHHGLLQATAYDKGERIIKEFRVQSFQQIENVWMVRTLEIHAPLTGARGRLEILDAKR